MYSCKTRAIIGDCTHRLRACSKIKILTGRAAASNCDSTEVSSRSQVCPASSKSVSVCAAKEIVQLLQKGLALAACVRADPTGL